MGIHHIHRKPYSLALSKLNSSHARKPVSNPLTVIVLNSAHHTIFKQVFTYLEKNLVLTRLFPLLKPLRCKSVMLRRGICHQNSLKILNVRSHKSDDAMVVCRSHNFVRLSFMTYHRNLKLISRRIPECK